MTTNNIFACSQYDYQLPLRNYFCEIPKHAASKNIFIML